MGYDALLNTTQSSPLRNFCAIRKEAEIKEREKREEILRKLLTLYNSEEFEESRKEDYATLLKQLPKLINEFIDDVQDSFFRHNTDKKSSPDIEYKMIMRIKSLKELHEMLNMKNLEIEKKPPANQVNNSKPTQETKTDAIKGLPPRAEDNFRPKPVEPESTYYENHDIANVKIYNKEERRTIKEFRLLLLAEENIDKKADEENIKKLREYYSDIITFFEKKLNEADQELERNTIYNGMISINNLVNRVLYKQDELEQKIEGGENQREKSDHKELNSSGQDKPQNNPKSTLVKQVTGDTNTSPPNSVWV